MENGNNIAIFQEFQGGLLKSQVQYLHIFLVHDLHHTTNSCALAI